MSVLNLSSRNQSRSYGNQGPLILGLSLAEFVIATSLVGLRVYYVISKIIPRAGWSLYWISASWFFGTLSQIFLTMSAAYGIGNHTTILEENHTLINALKWAWIGQLIVLFAIGLGKIAVVTFLLSVQGPTFRRKRSFLIFLAVANLAIDTACLFEIAFHCSPPRALWDVNAGVCHNPKHNLAMGYFTGSWNAASDFVLACYPILLFWNLQISKMLKVALCGLLGLGIFAAICSAIKTWQVHAIASTEDPAYDLTDLLIWAWTEMWTVLIAASVAPLWPVFRRYFHHVSMIVKQGTSPANKIPLEDQSGRFPKPNPLAVHKNDTTLLQSQESNDDKIIMTRDVHLCSEPVRGSGGSSHEGSHKGNAVLPSEPV